MPGSRRPTTADDLKIRTKRYALRVLTLCSTLPHKNVTDVLGRQLLRSGTSVGANYRAACRARSRAEFASRMGIVEEEADESAYWIELLIETGQVDKRRTTPLVAEARELTAIAAASRKTARRKSNQQSSIDIRQST